ncbi:MAG: hypothetical protein ACRDYE_08895, partial [Acidimicrobiales bacterium]
EGAFEVDRWLWRQRRLERGGRLYARLGVRRWKGRLPEAGGWFAGGFTKAQLASRDPAYLARFVRETRRAELGHWLAMAAAPGLLPWNPPAARVALVAYALASNLPCVATQRYNRARLRRVLAGGGGQAVGPAPAPEPPPGPAGPSPAVRKMDSR